MKTQSNFFQKLYQSFKEFPVSSSADSTTGGKAEPASFLNPLAGGLGDDSKNSEGISLYHLIEVLKVVSLSPQIISKHEIHSLFIQSLTIHGSLSQADFYYFMFILYHNI